jgi:hypothetical protein
MISDMDSILLFNAALGLKNPWKACEIHYVLLVMLNGWIAHPALWVIE